MSGETTSGGSASPSVSGRDLADSIRQLIRHTRSTTVDASAQARALALIDEAAAILGAGQHDGPYWQSGARVFEEFVVHERFQDTFPWSPAFGAHNPLAPKVEFEFDTDGVLTGTAWFDSYHCGPPWDITHGGLVALLYDDILGSTAAVTSGGGFTGRLSVSYRSPTPLHEPIRLRAQLESSEGRKFVVRGTMHHGDTLLSEAEGLFIRPANDPAGSVMGGIDFSESR